MSLDRSLIKALRYVSILDPAIDRDAEGAAEALARYQDQPDIATLPLRAGATPAIFELAPLTMKQRTRVIQLGDEHLIEQSIEAVACSLRSVSGYSIDGAAVEIEHEKGGEKRVKAECLERIFDELLFVELGARIMGINRLRPTSG